MQKRNNEEDNKKKIFASALSCSKHFFNGISHESTKSLSEPPTMNSHFFSIPFNHHTKISLLKKT